MKLLSVAVLYVIFIPAMLYAQKEINQQTKLDTSNQALFTGMRKLALEAKAIGHSNLADSIADVYKICYLDTLNNSALFTKSNFEFISDFPDVIHSNDRIFKFFYDSTEAADELVGGRQGYGRDLIKYIINREEIDAHLFQNGRVLNTNPNWKRMYTEISQKYGKPYADDIIPAAQFGFYRQIGNWKGFARLFDDKIRRYPPSSGSNALGGVFGDSWTINAAAWDIFLHCKDKGVLEQALRWSNLSISLCKQESDAIQYLDTKANLLYKLGKDSLAIQTEEKAIVLGRRDTDYQANLAKMRTGIPTWPAK